ncbi:MAG TPA: hypothetical protein PLL76_23605, partial [Thermoanaerobaculia bacterium]|nr:hypothetical protein [Thermoanaerobaculia bacterium]
MGKREAKRREMAKLMTRWRTSGKSAASFAREAGMPESRLWYWKRRIGGAEAPAFVPVRIVPEEQPPSAACFELTFGDGRRLVIPPTLLLPAKDRAGHQCSAALT